MIFCSLFAINERRVVFANMICNGQTLKTDFSAIYLGAKMISVSNRSPRGFKFHASFSCFFNKVSRAHLNFGEQKIVSHFYQPNKRKSFFNQDVKKRFNFFRQPQSRHQCICYFIKPSLNVIGGRQTAIIAMFLEHGYFLSRSYPPLSVSYQLLRCRSIKSKMRRFNASILTKTVIHNAIYYDAFNYCKINVREKSPEKVVPM